MNPQIPVSGQPPRSVRALAVIGSAGRGSDRGRVSPALYERMASELGDLISEIGSVECLVSGGAAFADHLAVGFFLRGMVPCLELFLPASFSLSANQYVEPYRKSPGYTSNYWHEEFSRKCGGSSLAGLGRALASPKCEATVMHGFEKRNEGIAARADGVVAFTFGCGAELKPGGSAGTMRLCLARGIPSWHVDLHTLKRHSPALVPADK